MTEANVVWPTSVSRGRDGALNVNGLSVIDLAREYGTPSFIVSEEDFRDRATAFALSADTAFSATLNNVTLGGARVFYASKAFLTTAIARWMHESGLGIDVCTEGELAVALKASVPAANIIAHGNNKSFAYLDAAIASGVGYIVVDSMVEIERVAAIARSHDRRQSVLIRVNAGIEAHTHEYIRTAHTDQKFGLSIASGVAMEGAQAIIAHPELELQGFHIHMGSQILDPQLAAYREAATRMFALHAEVIKACDVSLPVMDLGGGFGIAYNNTQHGLQITHSVGLLAEMVAEQCAQYSIPAPTIFLEPGRSIAGPTTFTMYEIGTVKPVTLDDGSVRTYISVDGGMSDNIRPALYGEEYTAELANRISNAELIPVRIVGSHCETGDVLIQDAQLPADTAPGDLLAIAATGAYGYSMASNYNHVPKPAVIAVEPPQADRDISGPGGKVGTARIIVRRETLDDLLRLDVDDYGVHR